MALFLCLSACGGGGDEAPPVPCTVELNGDSVMYGQGLQESPAMGLLRERPHWSIDDRSASGLALEVLMSGYIDPTSAYQRNPAGPFTAIPHPASVVVIEQGGIDALVGIPVETFEANLRAAVAHLQAQGRTVVLTGIVKAPAGPVFTSDVLSVTERMTEVTYRVARETGATHAGWDTVEFHGLPETLDGIHRTQPASNRLVSRLAAVIDPHLASCVPLPAPQCPGLEPAPKSFPETHCTKANP